MGMPEVTATMPDTFGLQEYFISDIVAEIDGPNIRIVCGVKRGGSIHWLYSCVMRADLAILACRGLESVACAGFTLSQLFEGMPH